MANDALLPIGRSRVMQLAHGMRGGGQPVALGLRPAHVAHFSEEHQHHLLGQPHGLAQTVLQPADFVGILGVRTVAMGTAGTQLHPAARPPAPQAAQTVRGHGLD